MKKELNNIVVEVLDLEHGKEVIKTFKELGVDTNGNIGNCTSWFYGLINNDFNPYNNDKIKQSNAKIITLDELKDMKPKEDVYPKLMWVIDNHEHFDIRLHRREIIFKNELGYWAVDNIDKRMAYCWKYAQDIEEENPEPKKEIINITLPHHFEAIIMINGKEVEFKKQDQ